MATAISNLPFDPDVPVTVVLTGSPFKIKPRSQLRSKVFFSVPGQETLQAVDQLWTSMQLFSPGQQFINGSFIGFDRNEEEKTLFVNEISDIQEDQTKNHLDSFKFKLPKEETQLNEECITFLSKGLKFVVPCMQIIRTFYATHRFMVKMITTQDDLSAFIESESKNDISNKMELTFKEWLSLEATKPMVNSFVLVYYIPELKKGWEKIVSNYINTGIFKASLPKIPNLQLTFKGYKIDDFFYVNRIIWCNEPKLPFRWLLYYPKKDKIKKEKTKKETEKAINTEKTLKSDNLVVNEPGVSPGKSSPTKRTRSPKTQAFSLSYKIQRAGDLKTADKSSPLYSVEEGFDIVSTKSPTEKGTAKKLDIVTSKNTIDIPSNESFPDFCIALNDLGERYRDFVENITVFFGECPDNFSYCTNDSGEKRKYMVADISLKNHYYHLLVIDLENTIHSTSAMLIIRKNDEDAKTQASKLINKLVYTGKGHWTSSCFDEIGSSHLPHNTLKHYIERSPYKWAELIKRKIEELLPKW